MACIFQATIGGVFAPLIDLTGDVRDKYTMIIIYNTAVSNTTTLKGMSQEKCPESPQFSCRGIGRRGV